jgi:hypothetical protein
MSYYQLPLLKQPVWTWEIPAYFFVGGTAGAAAVVGAVAHATGGSPALVRDARWIAAVGGAASPALLVSDLGRPERFLNMLRVFKLQSPMSVGAWTLVAFSSGAGAAAFADAATRVTGGRLPVKILGPGSSSLPTRACSSARPRYPSGPATSRCCQCTSGRQGLVRRFRSWN